VVNYLAQLYASSGNYDHVELVNKMLKYMMQHDRDGIGSFMFFPNGDTCNAVLLALLERYEGTSASDIDTEVTEVDFYFARGVLDYMCGRSKTACWPDSTTHELMLRFLDALNPADIKNIAEDLVSTIEARQFLSRFNSAKITSVSAAAVWTRAISWASATATQ
jgi:hypothetical protein